MISVHIMIESIRIRSATSLTAGLAVVILSSCAGLRNSNHGASVPLVPYCEILSSPENQQISLVAVYRSGFENSSLVDGTDCVPLSFWVEFAPDCVDAESSTGWTAEWGDNLLVRFRGSYQCTHPGRWSHGYGHMSEYQCQFTVHVIEHLYGKVKTPARVPDGDQINSILGAMLGKLKSDTNTEKASFPAPYERVWAAAKDAARDLDAVGGRNLYFLDEASGKITNGSVSENQLESMRDWRDQFVIHVTKQTDSSTSVAVTRRVEARNASSSQWKTRMSNGEIERWVLKRIEDFLKPLRWPKPPRWRTG
jgi:hypothetical protein